MIDFIVHITITENKSAANYEIGKYIICCSRFNFEVHSQDKEAAINEAKGVALAAISTFKIVPDIVKFIVTEEGEIK